VLLVHAAPLREAGGRPLDHRPATPAAIPRPHLRGGVGGRHRTRERSRSSTNPGKIGYAKLLDVFWHNVDPLTPEAQFCDHGHQYRTAIFYHEDTQRRLAESRSSVSPGFGRPIATEIVAATTSTRPRSTINATTRRIPCATSLSLELRPRRRLKELWGDEAPAAEAETMRGKDGIP